MTRKVRIFDLQFDEDFRREFAEGCEQIFDEAYLTDHTFVRRFEQEFATYASTPFSVMTTNCTSALEVALKALGVEGKEVLLPTNTFIATHVAILNAGGIPRPLDVEADYFSLSPEKVANHITPETGAVITVHIGGLISPSITKLVELCEKNGVPLLEDCAHAHGASYQGTPAGSFGVAGCFSHYLTKVMTTGEGGSVVTHDEHLYDRMMSLRRFGMDPNLSISHLLPGGHNFKVTEFQGLLGLLELKRLPQRLKQRQQIAAHYQQRLAGTEWRAIGHAPDSVGSYYKQVVLPPYRRSKVSAFFASREIALTGGVYYIPLHQQPVYKERYAHLSFPVSDAFCSTHICPPCYPELTLEDIDAVVDTMLAMDQEQSEA